MKTTTIQEACQLVTDGTHESFRDAGEGIPFLTVKDMSSNGLDFIGCSHITHEEYAKADAGNSSPKYGDILFSKDGTVGKVHVVSENRNFAVLSSIAILRPKKDILDSQYFGWVLRFPNTLKQAEQRKTGSALRRIILKDLKNVKIPLPPIAQQKRIAAILDKAEELRELRRQALRELDAIAQSIFIEMFGDPIENPKRYQIKKLIEIVDPERPITYGILKPGPEQDSGVLYIRVVDMKEGGIELSNIRRTTSNISNAFKRSLLRENDLLLSIRGHVGRLAVVPAILTGANITQDTARLAIKDFEPTFVLECLRTDSFQRWMTKYTKGVAVRGINLGDVKQMPIITPPFPIQQEFAHRIKSIEQLKTTHRESLAQLDALFASLQHRAFRGEL